MNYYVDFEASQCSNHIISIGCVSDNNETFYTLCKTSFVNEKVGDFVTELTGITDKMLEEAPTAEEAFKKFYTYIQNTRGETRPVFYCYGNADKGFLRSTSEHFNSLEMIIFSDFIINNLIDYSPTARTLLSLRDNVALKKIYTFISKNNDAQWHNAMEDAKMLQFVVRELPTNSNISIPVPNTLPSKKKNSKRAPEKFIQWPSNKLEADTGELNCKYVWTDGNDKKYFDTFDTMVMWAMKYCTKGRSIKRSKDIEVVERQLKYALKSGQKCYRGYWKENNDEVVCA